MGNSSVKEPTRLRESLWKALVFINTHPGTRRRAMFGFRYVFIEPTLKKAPFRLQTVEELIELGLVETKEVKGKSYELVQVSAKGKDRLCEIHPVDKLGRRKRLAKNWC